MSNDQWNAALEAAIRAIEATYDIPSTWRFQAADIVRRLVR
jgi:hypothetical protein